MWDIIYRPEGWIALSVMYAIVTFIVVRRIPLFGSAKWLFGLTVAPLFFVLVWGSSVAARHFFPEAVAYAESPTFHVGYLRSLGSMAVTFLLVVPLPAFISWLWFLFCQQLGKTRTQHGI